MTVIQSALLGILQGLTEFLPVSSSGHLVILENIFNVRPGLSYIILLHLATLLSVVVYFLRDIADLAVKFFSSLWGIITCRAGAKAAYYSNTQFKVSCLLLLATIVTGAIGFSFKDSFEALFSSVLAVGVSLMLTGVLIVSAELIGKGRRFAAQMNFLDAIVIGLFQGLAIAPGLSRSGATISSSLAVGLKRDFAARFSFLLSIPAIIAAALYELKDLMDIGQSGVGLTNASIGFIAAFISGLIAIKIFMAIIQRMSLRIFAYYCFAVGAAVIIWSVL